MASDKNNKNFAAKVDAFINDKYIPLNKNIKIGIAAGLPILVVALFVFLFYMPKQEEIGKLQTKKKELTEKVDKAQKAADNKEQHEKELAEAKKIFEETSEILPKEQELPGLLRNIADLGKRAGLDFLEFKPGNEVPKDFYAEIPISISINGPYHNIGYFLGEVSGLERLVTVDNIKMGSAKEVEREVLLKSSCNLLTYRFTGQAAAPPPAKADPKKK
jgi:type IV pilus assembly protein PilO